jgi:poly(3-hydroxybutyrate) depolymerase
LPPAIIAPGFAQEQASIAGTPLTIYSYRPACPPRLLLLVFHGVGRNAGGYRDHARPLADQVCAIVAAPEFDKARFPTALYQYGGTAKESPGERTIDLVPPLAAWLRQAAGAPGLPLVLLGHSAGAQFLGRVAAFVPTGAAAIILANPSTWVWPSTDIAMPFGFGGAPAAEAALRGYLAQPVTVLVGTADTGAQELVVSPPAMAQGPNRYTRGLNAFHAAQDVARAHGWPFGWALLQVPGVGHSATAMFASAQALEAVRRAVP